MLAFVLKTKSCARSSSQWQFGMYPNVFFLLFFSAYSYPDIKYLKKKNKQTQNKQKKPHKEILHINTHNQAHFFW